MTVRPSTLLKLSCIGLITGLLALGSIGGCPVAQQPTVPADNGNENANTSSDTDTSGQPRPIPPPPVDDSSQDGGTGGGTGGTGGSGVGSGGSGGSGNLNSPLTVLITAPQDADINTLAGRTAAVSYEVAGGNSADGQVTVELFYDLDGLDGTKDETTLKSALPPRGTAEFDTTSFNSGIYFLAIRAKNNRTTTTVYAGGRLVIVGKPVLTLTSPTADQRVRPNTGVGVQFTIKSLATTVAYDVYADPDTTPDNGNEIFAFSGGGLSGNGTIFTENYEAGTYSILVKVSDSTGQTIAPEYLKGGDGKRRAIIVDRAPTIKTTKPSASRVIVPGEKILVEAEASDPEVSATIKLFRDADASFNGNESVFFEAPLTQLNEVISGELDTTGLSAGTYRLGASISDGVGNPIASYAAGTIRVNAAPTVQVSQPSKDTEIRSGQVVQVVWSAKDFENRLERIQILVSPDLDGDNQPDIAWDDPATLVKEFTGSDTRTVTTYNLETGNLVDRALVAVRAIDDVGAASLDQADGAIIVLNDPPVVTITSPTQAPGLRGDGIVQMVFIVSDREKKLRPQNGNPPGIQVVVAADEDRDGVPDGDPLWSVGPSNFSSGLNFFSLDVASLTDLLDENGNGVFTLGVRAEDTAGKVTFAWVDGTLIIDSVVPEITVLEPAYNRDPISRDKIGTLDIHIETLDTSITKLNISLDLDTLPNQDDGTEVKIVENEEIAAGPQDLTYSIGLEDVPPGTYFLFVSISDFVDPTIEFYAHDPSAPYEDPPDPRTLTKIRVRDRLVGVIHVQELDKEPLDNKDVVGTVWRGFNVNDMAGTAMSRIPDMNNDGLDEFLVTSRYGKAYLIDLPLNGESYGFGESYLVYGNRTRTKGIQSLNAVSRSLPGVVFPGLRVPQLSGRDFGNRGWIGTDGVADFALVPDEDGDELPELVFGYPRVESLGLGETDRRIQNPSLLPDIPGMGSLEYNAWDPIKDDPNDPDKKRKGVWNINKAQFTRGGVVIVSSHNAILQNTDARNRFGDRVVDLHEVGQMFSSMSAPTLVPYIRSIYPWPADDINENIPYDYGSRDGDPRFAPFDGGPTCEDCDQDSLNIGACCVEGTCDEANLNQWACLQLGGTYYGDNVRCIATKDGEGAECTAEADELQSDECSTEGPPYFYDRYEEPTTWWRVQWDVVFNNQGPGGFHMPWTSPAADPPLASPQSFPWGPCVLAPPPWIIPTFYDIPGAPCGDGSESDPTNCAWASEWYDWTGGLIPFPCTQSLTQDSWCESGARIWTGFYGPHVTIRDASIGARILGQNVNDRFGQTVTADDTWLYMSAPNMTAIIRDVPALQEKSAGEKDRANAGVVYQLRTNVQSGQGQPTKAQLWLEPGQTWPEVDAELVGRRDYTMPVPHQYILETTGSLRGRTCSNDFDEESECGDECGPLNDWVFDSECPPPYSTCGGEDANACRGFLPYSVDTAGFLMNNEPQQIVGPHIGSKIRYTRSLSDLNGDGIRDFAVGAEEVKENFNNVDNTKDGSPLKPSGKTVGAVFVVYGRPTGVQGDYLLERLAYPTDSLDRLNGVLIKGDSDTTRIGRSFEACGDFTGDGVGDVIIGSELQNSEDGEVVILIGSNNESLLSPVGGWRFSDDMGGRAIRFKAPAGAKGRVGTTVAAAGDVDGDGIDDILISAPNLEDPDKPGSRPGVVYLIYGSRDYSPQPFDDDGDGFPDRWVGKTLNLEDIATAALPGIKFVGRKSGDALGAGSALVKNASPSGDKDITVFSRGLATLGDLDGDGLMDYAISSMNSDASAIGQKGKKRAGEVYVIYGRGDQE